MTMPSHHIPAETLVEYAAGNAPEALSLVVACHATLCAACRHRLRALDAIGGALLERAAVAPLGAEALARAMARLGERATEAEAAGSDVSAPAPIADGAGADADALVARLPGPLRRLVAGAKVAWRPVTLGIRSYQLPLRESSWRARLVRFRPGLTIAHHDHGGDEYTVVLTGAIEEVGGRFAPGDVCVKHPGDRHTQHIASAEPCIALLVQSGDLLPLTWLGKLAKLIARE
jgi:putative transcriptional regulator